MNFISILQFIDHTKSLSKESFQQLEQFTQTLFEKTAEIEHVFESVRKKYDFENLINVPLNQSEVNGKVFSFNRIGFWMERYEFTMSIGIEGNMDEEFMLIIKEQEVFLPYTEEISDEEREKLFRISFKIFYSWLGYIWQKKQLSACGVPMCIEVNSDTMTYYFNDYLKHYYSAFHNLYPGQRISGSVFLRDLSLEEIFISTYFFRDNVSEIYLFASRSDQFVKINMVNEKYAIFKGDENTNGVLIEACSYKLVHSYKQDEECSIKKVIEAFRTLINDNWIFDLNKSSFKV